MTKSGQIEPNLNPDHAHKVESECPSRVIRSGSWRKDLSYARTSSRGSYDTNVRYPTHGFRVALSQ